VVQLKEEEVEAKLIRIICNVTITINLVILRECRHKFTNERRKTNYCEEDTKKFYSYKITRLKIIFKRYGYLIQYVLIT